MNLTRREMGLAWGTLFLLLSLLLFLAVSGRWEEGRRGAEQRRALQRRARTLERQIARRGQVETRLESVLERLPAREPGQDVTADLLRDLERLAREREVTLTRREADRERRVGDVFEVSVTASWEADLEALVAFLYALETQGAMRQVRQLTASSSRDHRLKGTVVVDHAYVRSSPAAPEGAAQARE